VDHEIGVHYKLRPSGGFAPGALTILWAMLQIARAQSLTYPEEFLVFIYLNRLGNYFEDVPRLAGRLMELNLVAETFRPRSY